MASRLRLTILGAAALAAGGAAPRGPVDADSRAWWALTAALSNDAMQGRDTGSPGHERAARMVAARLAAAGVRPAGENGGFFQRIPLEETAVTAARFSVDGKPLVFLDQFTVVPDGALPAALSARVAYRGYCARGALGDVRGKLVVCHATRKPGLTTAAEREAAVLNAGAAGLVSIADPGFTREPPRWPYAYARSVDIAGTAPPPDPFPRLTLNADALRLLLPGVDAAVLIRKGAAGEPLPALDGGLARLGFATASRRLTSPNVVGVLPGTDPKLADQAIVLSAHLDGYGRGRAVKGDAIYNGTLDDAAYVALLVRLAERRRGRGFARPVIFAAWTGEEKGLLGSRWFVAHPTRPLSKIAGVINLDQLRPIFPLKLLTVHARTDTTLGEDASAVAAARGIAVQDDPEPERGLLRRTDHWPFIQAGVPGVNFVFGYTPGSRSEGIYRGWYRTGYHKPQDDLKQPMDWQAAADFNRFFYALVERVAGQPAAPAWKKGSKLRPAS
ncbi:M28 family peptidase [Parablastomonas sp. CN1-191]|uniref:M28 family peptidase n=1 Tax=Parablastomonas sp. CN1-191 TaxID=3400908 RepID=UPI003BF8FE9E